MTQNLTKAQEAKMPVYIDKWTQNGLSTKQIKVDDCKHLVNDFYTEILDKSVPENILIFDSPLSLWKYVQEQIGHKIKFIRPFLAGNFDSNIFAVYDFFINEVNIQIEQDLYKKYTIWRELSKVVNLVYPFDDVCLISQKPTKIIRNERGLHCNTGPALEYNDGFKIWALNGVVLPEEYVTTPWNKLDPKAILTERNAEIRRELVRKIGIERIIEKLGAEVIDSQGNYDLLLLDIGDNNKRPYLKMKNPSIGTYHVEGVEPRIRTVKDALIWRNGTDESPIILT